MSDVLGSIELVGKYMGLSLLLDNGIVEIWEVGCILKYVELMLLHKSVV